MTTTESIIKFLTARKKDLPGEDLIDKVLANEGMEIQVNVGARNGEPVAGKKHTYSDGINTWHSIRIPHNAKDEPEWHDYEMSFPLDVYADTIGCTGWDWKARCSRWVGFDFDAITSHAEGVGITEEALNLVREKAQALPYVTVRRSTGGSGLHLYVEFDAAGVPTANHTEHAALARCILGMMSSEAGFDFAQHIDCCGSVLWVWATKISQDNGGLKLIKAAEKQLCVNDLPTNWMDHLDVVRRKRTKVKIEGIDEEAQDPFEALAMSRKMVPLDDCHKATIDALTRSGFSTVWIPDYHMLQCHTKAFQTLIDDPTIKEELGLQGFFETNSQGNDPGTPNCFAFPLRRGGWKVFRFSQGIAEAVCWEQTKDGWTTTTFNRAPDLRIAARAFGGVEDGDKEGRWLFATAADAIKAAAALGQTIELDAAMLDREATLTASKSGRLVATVKREGEEVLPGWGGKRDKWSRIFDVRTEQPEDEVNTTEHDNVIRTVVSPVGERAGWVMKSSAQTWDRVPKDDIRNCLAALGNTKDEANAIIGMAQFNRWQMVHLPFQPEYPGGRSWNRDAPQLKFMPSEAEGPHPHWDMIYDHVFAELTPILKEQPWYEKLNIRTGADYGRMWAACMFRYPFEPLPYLFLYGPEDSGKSIMFESLRALVTNGVNSVEKALRTSGDFNGELENCVLAYIDDVDLSKCPHGHNRIKEWVTAKILLIRKMRTDPYNQPNTLHFIQCANNISACPIFPGDTRITAMYVGDLLPEQKIPKTILEDRLIEEAPNFLATLMNLTLPPVVSRLRLPVVTTAGKLAAEEHNEDAVETFIKAQCTEVDASDILFSEFYAKFVEWLDPADQAEWSKRKTTANLPVKHGTIKKGQNKLYIRNLAWKDQ